MKLRQAIGWLALALVFTCLGAIIALRQDNPRPDDPAKILLLSKFEDATGRLQAMEQWKGRPLVVNFWATWCPPCVEEMPELEALQKELAGSKAQIVGIGIDNSKNIADFSIKYRISFPLYVGQANGLDLSRQLGNPVGGLPFTVLIGADGKVKQTYLGRLKVEKLRADLATLKAP